MKPTTFPNQNCVYAKDQLEYRPLPAHKTEYGEVITCWKLTFLERIKILFNGKIWHRTLTFNEPLQPLTIDTVNPWMR